MSFFIFSKSLEAKLTIFEGLNVGFNSILPIYVIPYSDQEYRQEDSSFDICIVFSCEVGALDYIGRDSTSTIFRSSLRCNRNGCAHHTVNRWHA